MPFNQTDLQRLSTEIQAAEDALPCNLSNYWLRRISEDLAEYFEGDEDEQREGLIHGAVMVITRIIEYKASRGKIDGAADSGITLSWEQLFRYFHDYHIEISLEMINRFTDIGVEPATLETIFEARDIEYRKKAY